MAITEEVFTWAASAFLFGVILCLHTSTVLASVRLHWKRRSTFHLAIASVCIACVTDLLLINLGTPPRPPDLPSTEITPGTAAVRCIGIVLEAYTEIGFTGINFYRFYRLAFKTQRKLTQALGALVGVSICYNFAANTAYFVYLAQLKDYTAIPAVNDAFGAWSVYDACVNLGVAIAFTVHLRTMAGENQLSLRAGLHPLLRHMQVLVLLDSIFTVITACIIVFAYSIDPLWFFYFFSQAFRLRVLCSFFVALNKIMRKKRLARWVGGGGSTNSATASVPAKSQPTLTADVLAQRPDHTGIAVKLTEALNRHRAFHFIGGGDGLLLLFPSVFGRVSVRKSRVKTYQLRRVLDRSTLLNEPELATDVVLMLDVFLDLLERGPIKVDAAVTRFKNHPAMRLRPNPPSIAKLAELAPSHFGFNKIGQLFTPVTLDKFARFPLDAYLPATNGVGHAAIPPPAVQPTQKPAPPAVPTAPAAPMPKHAPVQVPTPAATPTAVPPPKVVPVPTPAANQTLIPLPKFIPVPAPIEFAPAPVLPAATAPVLPAATAPVLPAAAAPVPAPFHPSTAAPAPAPPPAAAAVAAEGFLDAPVPRPLETDVDPTQVRDWIRKPLPLLVPVHARFDPENPARIQWRSAAVPPPPAPQNEDPEEAAFNARVRAEVEDLLALLPRDLYDRICEALPGNAIDELDEISLDLGMPPRLRFLDLDDAAADSAARAHDGVLDLDDFGPVTRAMLDIAGRDNATPVGLTLRIGRAAPPHTGLATVLLRDLLARGESILVVGRPGTGKTHTLRDICARLSEGDKTSSSSFARRRRNVMIVDTSGEVGGPGDVAHPSLRRCRRMHVPSRARQHESMLEAVQNHTPDVVAVDEISNGREAHAARSVSTRVHAIVATVHGSLASVLRNRELRDIFGGITSSTVGDERAERELGGRKELVARASDAVFTAAVELVSRSEVRIVHNVNEFVDDLLDFNKSAWIERRRLVPGSSKTVFESTVEVYEDVRSDEIV
ncbi:hypothetical protein H9P43_005518 [Blastocladiella emersonii ATCC 22665]|nr:hypothetical protein H9P43_005518 [Blastocladiella emersonii ATCC 22665]